MKQGEILEAVALLTEYLEEAHQDELDNNHYDDEPGTCSYCHAIAKGKEAMNELQGEVA